MGWDTSSRRTQLPPGWARIRKAVRDRAGGKCEWLRVTRALPWLPQTDTACPAYGTDCDHIQRGGPDTPANLAWLCADHHQTKSSLEGGHARAAKYTTKRPAEQHPGLR